MAKEKIMRKRIAVLMLMFCAATLLFLLTPSVQTSPTWFIETVDSSGGHLVGMYTSIALDSAGRPHISYHEWMNGDLKYARWTGSTWNIQTVHSTGHVGQFSSIALDSTGRPHISYYDNTNGDLKYARWTGSTWNIQTVHSIGDVGHYTSIALDSADRPHISYYDYTNVKLKYVQWTGFTWNVETVDPTGYGGVFTSIALDSSDNPYISYSDVSNYDLKVARWTGFTWNIQTVDSTGMVGHYTSIALDSADRPHISYEDWSNEDLKYARWTGSTWNIQTVDPGTTTGKHTSIALDSSDNPHISYLGSSSLKYARWGVHDVAVTDVTPSKTIVGLGYSLPINVTVENQGDFTETCNIAMYIDGTIVDSVTDKILSSGDSKTVTFTWDTTGFAYGDHEIEAYVNPVPGETDTTDNYFSYGYVLVTIPGDVNGDRIVDIFDIGYISAHWYPGPPIGPLGYDANADVNGDGSVDIFDIGITSAHWGESW